MKQKKFRPDRFYMTQHVVTVKHGNAVIPYHTVDSITCWSEESAKRIGTDACIEKIEEHGTRYFYWVKNARTFTRLIPKKSVNFNRLARKKNIRGLRKIK